jgi:hypothetical protein
VTLQLLRDQNLLKGKWISNKTVQPRISDSGSGISSHNGYLNGNWILFEYDYKTEKITHDFSDGGCG